MVKHYHFSTMHLFYACNTYKGQIKVLKLSKLLSATRWRFRACKFCLCKLHYRAWGNAYYSLVDSVGTYAVTSGSNEQWYERNCTQIPTTRSLEGSKQIKFSLHLSATNVHNFPATWVCLDLPQVQLHSYRLMLWVARGPSCNEVRKYMLSVMTRHLSQATYTNST